MSNESKPGERADIPCAKLLEELAWEIQKLRRYEMDQCPYYGDPCMEQAKDGDYFYVWDVIEAIKNFTPSNSELSGR